MLFTTLISASNCDYGVELTADSRLLRYLKSKALSKFVVTIRQEGNKYKEVEGNTIMDVSPGQSIFFTQTVAADRTKIINQCREFESFEWIVNGKSCGKKDSIKGKDGKLTATWDKCDKIEVPADFEKEKSTKTAPKEVAIEDVPGDADMAIKAEEDEDMAIKAEEDEDMAIKAEEDETIEEGDGEVLTDKHTKSSNLKTESSADEDPTVADADKEEGNKDPNDNTTMRRVLTANSLANDNSLTGEDEMNFKDPENFGSSDPHSYSTKKRVYSDEEDSTIPPPPAIGDSSPMIAPPIGDSSPMIAPPIGGSSPMISPPIGDSYPNGDVNSAEYRPFSSDYGRNYGAQEYHAYASPLRSVDYGYKY
eukprot:NODE_156_length_16689_cov_0.273960.p4 type:complete len:365 gc:universal NODE_156_length_16689_cov_0.273960:1231-2325(+)